MSSMLSKNPGSWWSSIEARLIILIAAGLLPIVGFSAFLAYRYANAERHVIEAQRDDAASNLSHLLDGETGAISTLLSGLAQSPDLLKGDIETFRTYADRLVGERIAVIALLDASGQQLMSTFVPLDDPLPKRTDMSVFESVLRGKTLVSNVIQGTAVQRPIISIAVPVFRNKTPTYVLSAVVYPERFVMLFSKAGVNPEWAAAVVDREGRFVSRNLNPERLVGTLARPELGEVARGQSDAGNFENTTLEGVRTANSFRRSKLTGWTSVVSVPSTVLLEPVRRATEWMFIAATTVALLSIVFASFLARRIAKSIKSFSEAATTLVQGKPLSETPAYIKELSEVRAAFEHAQVVIAARNLADEHARFLLRELSHRSKNLIAIIQSIANQTLRSATSLEDFHINYAARLRGLSTSHDALINQDWKGASLSSLIHNHLAPFADAARIEVSCPSINLTPTATQAIGLALHELATNASKYGALSVPAGKVTVTCSVVSHETEPLLQICWIESGGPLVRPASRKGFGQVVIGHMVSTAVGGSATLEYEPAGFRWTLLISREHFNGDSVAPTPATRDTPRQTSNKTGHAA